MGQGLSLLHVAPGRLPIGGLLTPIGMVDKSFLWVVVESRQVNKGSMNQRWTRGKKSGRWQLCSFRFFGKSAANYRSDVVVAAFCP